jgi:ABC-type nitrate/sulfonate/bicarbonate transport system permease component
MEEAMKAAHKHKTTPVLGSAHRSGPLAFAGLLVFIGAWIATSYFGWVNSLLLPSPLRVIGAASDVGPKLLEHLAATILRIGVGFGLGVSAGMSLGILMQYNQRIYQFFDGIIETFRPVPPVAVVPFFILLFGFSEVGKILVTVIGVGLLATITTVEAIERVPAALVRWGLVIGLSRAKLFRLIILPAVWPEMRGGFRIAMALAITLVVVSELMGATHGLGYLISVSKVTLTTPTLLLAIVILGWIGWGFDRLLRYVFDKTTAWDIRAKGATR